MNGELRNAVRVFTVAFAAIDALKVPQKPHLKRVCKTHRPEFAAAFQACLRRSLAIQRSRFVNHLREKALFEPELSDSLRAILAQYVSKIGDPTRHFCLCRLPQCLSLIEVKAEFLCPTSQRLKSD
jgi:hypothetical protein